MRYKNSRIKIGYHYNNDDKSFFMEGSNQIVLLPSGYENASCIFGFSKKTHLDFLTYLVSPKKRLTCHRSYRLNNGDTDPSSAPSPPLPTNLLTNLMSAAGPAHENIRCLSERKCHGNFLLNNGVAKQTYETSRGLPQHTYKRFMFLHLSHPMRGRLSPEHFG